MDRLLLLLSLLLSIDPVSARVPTFPAFTRSETSALSRWNDGRTLLSSTNVPLGFGAPFAGTFGWGTTTEVELQPGPSDGVGAYAVAGSPDAVLEGEGNEALAATVCGDGITTPPEQCDQGALDVPPPSNFDGCSSTCQIESGFVCSGAPSTCTCDAANGYSPSPDRAFCRRYDRAEAGAPDVDTTLHEEGSLRLGWNWSAEVVPRIDDGDDGIDSSQSLDFEIGTGSRLLPVLIASSGAGQATLAMWVDLDGDQLYAANELLAAHSGALVQGFNSWWLDFAVPASLQPGERDMRLRLFPDVFEASPTGVYPDGEVEDYVVSLVPRCGDGFIVAPEQCDQGSADPLPLDDGDGCSASCLIEPGWTCSNVPSICEFTGPPVPTSRPAGTWMLGALLVLLGAYQIMRRVEGTA